MMKINLNIISLFFFMILGLTILQGYDKLTVVAVPPCNGCNPEVKDPVEDAAEDINDAHKDLEEETHQQYKDDIKPLLLEIKSYQDDMAKVVVHMAALEREANMDDKKLALLLDKNREYHLLCTGK